MAERKRKPYDEEIRIPLFTVVKKGLIIKNIFLNVPPNPDLETSQDITGEATKLLMGRHPDCQIVLDHPSVSRFHLEVRLHPSLQKLFVSDLSSVHGTWVSDQKLEPKVLKELLEGDELRLGASTRIYKLRWVSSDQAYEFEKPFMSLREESEENENMLRDHNPKLLNKKDEFWAATIPSAPPLPESSHHVIPDAEYCAVEMPKELEEASSKTLVDGDNESPRSGSSRLKEISVADEVHSPVEMPKQLAEFSSPVLVDGGDQSPTQGRGLEQIPFLDEAYSAVKMPKQLDEASGQMLVDGEYEIPQRRPSRQRDISLEKANYAVEMPIQPEEASKQILTYGDYQSPPRWDTGLKDVSVPESMGSWLPVNPSEVEEEDHITQILLVREVQFEKDNHSPHRSFLELGDPSQKESVSSSLPVQFLSQSVSPFDGKNKTPAVLMDRNALSGEVNRQLKQKDVSVAESAISSMPEKFLSESEVHLNCKNQSLKDPWPNALAERENRSPSSNLQNKGSSTLWSRRCKSASFIKVQTARSTRKTGMTCGAGPEAHISKENTDAAVEVRLKSFCKVLFPDSDGAEDSFTSDKENKIRNVSVSAWDSKKRNGRELKQVELNTSPSKFFDFEEDMFSSDKENLTPKVLGGKKKEKPIHGSQTRFNAEAKKRGTERIPFQALPVNPLDGCASVPNATSKTDYSSNSTQNTTSSNKTSENTPAAQMVQMVGEKKRKWHMVVDTSCFLDEDSWTSLKLLEGLKGTHLIIPRMVIRELDYLKRRGSWFKKSEEVSSTLQWIEDCMVNTNWWIHVQSSGESLPVAPTPPSSPHSWFSDGGSEVGVGTAGGVHLSKCGRLQEIVSPTAEDYVLECALLFKKIHTDGQLVLLTNDISLKIKAMAEGLLCETATEFRESLVNPYSERFLWVESIPRGPTWSCLDEAACLKESFGHYWPSVRKTTRAGEGAKGLKLILMHNSHYGQMHSVM
ncbi:FHA domain-containing protein PS1 [Aristolochia californica]|uniref:FHA domain-containing protein PS1 n=1 Tax=Aristolochia californica TaxID=171875 RepID=UPI0035D5CA86